MTKLTNEALGLAGILLTSAGLFFTFGTAPTGFGIRLGISNNMLLLAGAIVTAGGAGLIVWRLCAVIDVRIGKARAPRPILQARFANRIDLEELHILYVRQFGDEVPTLEQMRRWHACNPNIFRLVVESNPLTGAGKIVASFKAVPLKNATIPYLELEALTGTNLSEKHIVKPRVDQALGT
jgi:hypothetical protein